MAVNGWSNANNFTASPLFASGSERPMSLSVWLKEAGGGSDTLGWSHWFFSNFASDGNSLTVGMSTSGTKLRFTSGSDYDSTAFTADTNWHHYGVTWASGGTLTFYRDGASLGTTSAAIAGSTTGNSIVGSYNNYGIKTQGDLCELGIWNRELSAGEMAMLGKAYSPITIPRGLVSFMPMLRALGADPMSNRWTTNGSLSVAAHPRVIYPRRRDVKRYAAAPGGSFSTALFRENAGVGGVGGGPFARANAGLGAIA